MVNFLFSSGLSFYDIKPYYDNGDFSNLRVYLHQKEDEILSGKRSLEEEYQLLYIKIFEAKSLFCLGTLHHKTPLNYTHKYKVQYVKCICICFCLCHVLTAMGAAAAAGAVGGPGAGGACPSMLMYM